MVQSSANSNITFTQNIFVKHHKTSTDRRRSKSRQRQLQNFTK